MNEIDMLITIHAGLTLVLLIVFMLFFTAVGFLAGKSMRDGL